MSDPVNVLLIVGGQWHDMDYARLELLSFLSEQERLRVTVRDIYDASDISSADMLITYTCDLIPDGHALTALTRFCHNGGRWFALHGTNSMMILDGDKPVRCPPLPAEMLELLGSQFAAHPAPGSFKVTPSGNQNALIKDLSAFLVTDEQYLQHHLPGNEVLLSTRFEGQTPLFENAEWTKAEHQVMYLRRAGKGAVLYLTLGHCRGRYDMRPITNNYPFVERGAWPHPVFRELIRRGILWAMNEERFG